MCLITTARVLPLPRLRLATFRRPRPARSGRAATGGPREPPAGPARPAAAYRRDFSRRKAWRPATTTVLADRARRAARSWRDTADLRVSTDPADVESAPSATSCMC